MSKIKRQHRILSESEIWKYSKLLHDNDLFDIHQMTGISYGLLNDFKFGRKVTCWPSTVGKLNNAYDQILQEAKAKELMDTSKESLDKLRALEDENLIPIDGSLNRPEPIKYKPTLLEQDNCVPGVSRDVQALIDIHNIMETLTQGERQSVLNWFNYKYDKESSN